MNQPLTPDERLALEKLIGDGQEAPRGPTPPHSTQDPPLKCDELDVLLRKYSGATTAAPPPREGKRSRRFRQLRNSCSSSSSSAWRRSRAVN